MSASRVELTIEYAVLFETPGRSRLLCFGKSQIDN